MLRHINRDAAALVAAALAPLAVSGILVPLRTTLSAANAALILVVVVVAVASAGNRLAGGLSAISAAVWFDFLLTKPYQRLTITNPDDITAAVLLLVVGLAVSQLAARARRLQVVIVTNADYLLQIQQAVQLVQSGASTNTVVNQVRSQLVHLLGLTGCRFEYGVLLGQHPRLDHDGSIVTGRTRSDPDRDELPTDEIEMRIQGDGRYYGRYLLQSPPQNKPSLQARLVALTLADQVSAAFSGARPRPEGT